MPIAIIRHGNYAQPEGVPSAMLPYGLTPDGKDQSATAVTWLDALIAEKGWRVDPVIDSSRMRRAWETAQILATGLGPKLGIEVSVEEFDALAERSVGSLANLSIKEIEAIIAADPRWTAVPAGWKRDPDFKLPVQGAESLLEAGERTMQHLLARYPLDANTLKLIVGHGGAFRHAAHLMGILDREDVARLSMHYAQPVVFDKQPGRWQKLAGDWKVRSTTDGRLD